MDSPHKGPVTGKPFHHDHNEVHLGPGTVLEIFDILELDIMDIKLGTPSTCIDNFHMNITLCLREFQTTINARL